MGKPQKILCDPSLFEKDLSGKVVLITGAGAGIGLHCATKLFAMGATVVCAGRGSAQGLVEAVEEAGEGGSAPAPEAAPKPVSKKSRLSLVGNDLAASVAKLAEKKDRKPVILELDLMSLKSVRAFAATFQQRFDRLDVLMCNAGVMMPPKSLSEDGFESQMATNHYGHFLLVNLLKPLLCGTTDSRVVMLASCAAAKCTMMCQKADPTVDLDDMDWSKRKYEKDFAYGQSKLAQIMQALAGSRHWA